MLASLASARFASRPMIAIAATELPIANTKAHIGLSSTACLMFCAPSETAAAARKHTIAVRGSIPIGVAVIAIQKGTRVALSA